jgi:hypothetical protein
MNLKALLLHKKNIIYKYKNNIQFTGSIFTNDLTITYIEDNISYTREVITKYYKNDNIIINNLINRLKLKFELMDFNYIYLHTNYITLYNNNYQVKFYMQDSYGEFINPIILDTNQVKMLILHEKFNYIKIDLNMLI